MCTKLSEPIGTDLSRRYIKFGGNIKEYEYCNKFEIKYCGKIVLTDPFTAVITQLWWSTTYHARIPFLGGLGV